MARGTSETRIAFLCSHSTAAGEEPAFSFGCLKSRRALRFYSPQAGVSSYSVETQRATAPTPAMSLLTNLSSLRY